MVVFLWHSKRKFWDRILYDQLPSKLSIKISCVMVEAQRLLEFPVTVETYRSLIGPKSKNFKIIF